MKPQQVTLTYTAPTPGFPGKLRPKPLEVVGTAPAGTKGDKGDKGDTGASAPAGTAAMLAAGTDTAQRSWSAKDLADFFAKKA